MCHVMGSLICLLCGVAAFSHAAHPLVTDDAGTQGTGKTQLEFNSEWSRHNSASGHSAALTVTYGVRDALDVYVNVPHSLSSPRGILDAGLGAKWRFVEAGPTRLALKPELLLPTGEVGQGLGNGRASASMVLIGEYEAGNWTLLGNAGLAVNRYRLAVDRRDNHRLIWRASAAALYALSEKLRLAADLGLSRNSDKSADTPPAYFLTGVIYSPSPQLDLDIGLRRGLNCRSCSNQTARQAGVGMTLRF